MKNHKDQLFIFFKNILISKKFTLLFFTIYFTLGVLVFSDYGISFDETANRDMGFLALNDLRSLFNLDIYSGFEHSDKSYVNSTKQYGVIFDLPLAFLEKLFSINLSRNYFLLRHFAVFIVFFSSSIFFYLLIKKRFNKNLAFIGVLFLILSPRIFAESFYNMKDIIFLSFFNISLYFGFEFLDKITYKKSLIAAFACSLAINSRIIGVIVPFVITIFIFLILIENKDNFKKNYLKLVVFLLSLSCFTIVLWPYLWNDPFVNFISAFETMASYPMRLSVFYFGNYISSLTLPWHYSIVWILVTTPVLYIFLFTFGSAAILLNISKGFLELSESNNRYDPWVGNAERMDAIMFMIIYFTIFLVIILNATLYGGWRHLYFIYPCFIYISIKGINFISKYLHFKYLLILLFFSMFQTSFWMIKNHPYQFVYFNYFAGKDIANKFELDYWGTSNMNVLSYILNNESKDVFNIYVFSVSPYIYNTYMLSENNKKRINFVDTIEKADYLITNHYYQKGNPTIIKKELNKKYDLIKEFKVDNLTINSIYKVDNL